MSEHDEQTDPVDVQLQKIRDYLARADSLGDTARGIYGRLEYIKLAEFTGRYDEALVQFTWCISVCDKDEKLREKFGPRLLWQFKWIINSLVKYPEVSRAQLDKTFGEMRRWYDRAGKSHRAIHSLAMQAIRQTGDLSMLPRQRDLWLAAPEDDSKDCAACEASTLVESYIWESNWQRTLDVAQGLIEGTQKCAEQPQVAHMHLLLPLFYLGHFDLARHLQRRSYAQVVGNRERMQEMGVLLAFLTATDQLARASETTNAILYELPNVRRGWDRLTALIGVRIFLMRVQALKKDRIRLRLGPTNPLKAPDDICHVQTLLDFANSELTRLAAAFDSRNGNTYISAMTREYDPLLSQIRPYPPSPPPPQT